MQKQRFVGMRCFSCQKPIKKIDDIAVTHSHNGRKADVLCKNCAHKGKTLDWGVKKK